MLHLSAPFTRYPNLPTPCTYYLFTPLLSISLYLIFYLISLDRAVYLSHKQEGRDEPNSADKDGDGERGHANVAEVHNESSKSLYRYMSNEVVSSIKEDVDTGGARNHEALPPPPVILCAKMEVCHYNGDLRRGNRQDEKHQKDEAKQVVEFVLPNRGDNKEHLDKDGTEWHQPSQHDRGYWTHIPHLSGNLARYGIDPAWKLHWVLLQAEKASDKYEREGDEKPQRQYGNKRAEWNS
mmetsp:Transcript_11705/g.31519  ORF Transcript_11705/g.31519 Transcript_11705/m.31519 type:complete len:238 (+) Transcript_11705:1580-2293(+)